VKNYKLKAMETARYLKDRIEKIPKVAFLAGTGLGDSVRSLDLFGSFEYKDIPNFPISTVESHAGRLLAGTMGGKDIIVLQGRFHLYEGYSPLEITFPIRVMQELNIRILILSNASGGLNLDFKKGDLMIITDHINLTGSNPLVGPNEESWGPRFPDMISAYDQKLGELAENGGKESGGNLWKGIYVGLKGPSLETPAEMRYLRAIGADAVGFSTVQEVISAVHGGMKVLGLSTITNINDPGKPVSASVEEIIAVAKTAAPRLEQILTYVLERIDDHELR